MSLIKLFTSETLTNKPQGGTVQLFLKSYLPVTVWSFSHSVISTWLIYFYQYLSPSLKFPRGRNIFRYYSPRIARSREILNYSGKVICFINTPASALMKSHFNWIIIILFSLVVHFCVTSHWKTYVIIHMRLNTVLSRHRAQELLTFYRLNNFTFSDSRCLSQGKHL